jgi:hypothetical protein
MGKAKINFELDERVLAHAQAYAAQSRTSLSKLVSAFFAGLGNQQAATARSSMDTVLTEVAVGKVSVADAARELGLQDVGYLLAIMREKKLPLPAIDPTEVDRQAHESFDALKATMRRPPDAPTQKRPRRGKRMTIG